MIKAMQFKDAESCLNLTIQCLHLDKQEDRDFLEKAMKHYAYIVMKEINDDFLNAELEWRKSSPQI